jgi:hypothetical protein
MANTEPLLSFEEFRRTQNNFFLHFVGVPGEDHFGDVYRSQPAYVATLAAYPQTFGSLAQELCDTFAELHRAVLQDEGCMRKYYEAYRLMHPHARTNWELFA